MMSENAVRMTVCQHSSAMLIIRLHMISSPTGSASIRATASSSAVSVPTTMREGTVSARESTRLRPASTVSVQASGTMVVASRSSTIAGPSTTVPGSIAYRSWTGTSAKAPRPGTHARRWPLRAPFSPAPPAPALPETAPFSSPPASRAERVRGRRRGAHHPPVQDLDLGPFVEVGVAALVLGGERIEHHGQVLRRQGLGRQGHRDLVHLAPEAHVRLPLGDDGRAGVGTRAASARAPRLRPRPPRPRRGGPVLALRARAGSPPRRRSPAPQSASAMNEPPRRRPGRPGTRARRRPPMRAAPPPRAFRACGRPAPRGAAPPRPSRPSRAPRITALLHDVHAGGARHVLAHEVVDPPGRVGDGEASSAASRAIADSAAAVSRAIRPPRK